LRFFVFFWVAVEVLQLVVIGLLAAGYRNLQRRLDREDRFSRQPPPSITDESL
jgi:hypothetical protein